MSKIKENGKSKLFLWFIVIVIVIAIVGVVLGVSQYRKTGEDKLTNANNTINEIVTDAGIVDKDEGSFYITLYVTAGVIIILGVGIFIYVHKKADE